MEADPRAEEFRGKTALMRGPLLYCFEAIDNAATGVRNLAVEPGPDIRPFAPEVQPEALYQPAAELPAFMPYDRPDLLGGVTVLQGPAAGKGVGAELTAIPFYAWTNRGPTPMTVWIDRADGDGRRDA